jgi:hypothetical protein
MIHILQLKKYVFHVFVGLFPAMPWTHSRFPWIDLTEKSLDAVKRAGGSAEVVEYLHSKCEHKSKPQYHPNTSKTVLN